MTSYQRNGAVGASQLYPTFFSDLDRAWVTMFYNECERLAMFRLHLDDEELEAQAEEITNEYFYIKAKARLPAYLSFDILWRVDLR